MTMTANTMAEKTPGTVITFYSFKGGVGRSMALANIAVLLARSGKRVLCIDWDLEAPGLERYFRAVPRSAPEREPAITESPLRGGLLDILEHSTPEALAPWREYVRSRTAFDENRVDFIGSGEDAGDYSERLGEFGWLKYFDERRGGEVIEALRKAWKAEYDFVLVDSRTGLTDSSGVCTIQMPDLLILLFAANQQNTDWCGRVADGIRKGRRALPYDRMFLPIVPILARFDGKEESDRAAEAKKRIAERFAPYFADWLPRAVRPLDMLGWSALPYIPRYSFDEALAVEDEPTSGPDGLTFRYQLLSNLILSRFRGIRAILARVGVPGAAVPPMLPAMSELRAELRRDAGAAQRYRDTILARVEEEPQEAVDALETLARLASPSVAESLLGEAIRILEDPAVAKPEEIPRLLSLQNERLLHELLSSQHEA